MMFLKVAYPIMTFCFISIACFHVNAQQFTPPRILGIGGAGLAAYSGYQGGLINPATLVDGPQVEMGLFYQDRSGDGEQSHLKGLGFMDNGPIGYFSGSFNHYTQTRRNAGVKIQSEVYHLTIAERYNDVWSFGAGIVHQQNAISTLEDKAENNVDIGVMFTPYQELGFGLVITSLMSPDEDELPEGIARPAYIAVGVAYHMLQKFEFRLDLSQYTRGDEAQGKLKVAGGFESKIHKFFRLRGGFSNDDFTNENSYMAGIGFDGPKMRIDYGLQKITSDPVSEVHSVDLRIAF